MSAVYSRGTSSEVVRVASDGIDPASLAKVDPPSLGRCIYVQDGPLARHFQDDRIRALSPRKCQGSPLSSGEGSFYPERTPFWPFSVCIPKWPPSSFLGGFASRRRRASESRLCLRNDLGTERSLRVIVDPRETKGVSSQSLNGSAAEKRRKGIRSSGSAAKFVSVAP